MRKHTRVLRKNLYSGTLGVIRSVMIEKMGTESPICPFRSHRRLALNGGDKTRDTRKMYHNCFNISRESSKNIFIGTVAVYFCRANSPFINIFFYK